MIKTLQKVAIAAAAVTLTSSVALAQANLTFHTAGSGTPVALTATALVEYAADRGIANTQVSEGKVATNYLKDLAEGKIEDEADFTAGRFLRPSLVINADPALSVVRDEQLSPTLPVIAYDSEDEAVAMANDSDYGLSSSVWLNDSARAVTLARRLEAGFTNINSHGPTAVDGLSPFGGVKQSGIGRNFGHEGVCQFQEVHSIFDQSGQIF